MASIKKRLPLLAVPLTFLALAGLGFLRVPQAEAAVSLVNSNMVSLEGVGPTSTLDFNGGVQNKNDLLFVWATWLNRSTGVTTTDSLGNTWTPIYPSPQIDNAYFYQAWYAVASNVGTDTVTFAYSDGGTSDWAILGTAEFSGVATSSPLSGDGGVTATTSAITATTTGSVTLPDQLVIGFSGSAATGTYSAGSGFTIPSSNGQVTGASYQSGAIEWEENASVSGPASATMTNDNPSGGWDIGVATFNSASNDFTPPNVAITSPGNGATVSSTVTITASSTDNVAVKNVQFQVDGIDLGGPVTSTNSTYSISWDTGSYSNATHTITAISTDTSGNTASTTITVTVANNVDDWIYQDNGALNSDWGDYSYGGVTNNFDNTSTVYAGSSSIAVTYPVTGVVAFVSSNVLYPADYSALQLAIYATSSLSFNFILNGYHVVTTAGPEISTTTTANQWTLVTIPMSTLEPNYNEFDQLSLGTTATTTFYLGSIRFIGNSSPDLTPPSVAITSPGNGATVSSTVTLTASSTDDTAVRDVQFEVNGTDLGSAVSSSPYTASWNTNTYANGTYTVTAVATDVAGNSSSTSVTVTVDNAPDTTPPTVSIASPLPNASLLGTVQILANASDNVAVAGVQFQVDGADLGSEVTSSPYEMNWDTAGYATGAHTITAIAYDTSNNSSTVSETVNVVSSTPTEVSLVSSAIQNVGGSGTSSVPELATTSLSFGGGGPAFARSSLRLGGLGQPFHERDRFRFVE